MSPHNVKQPFRSQARADLQFLEPWKHSSQQTLLDTYYRFVTYPWHSGAFYADLSFHASTRLGLTRSIFTRSLSLTSKESCGGNFYRLLKRINVHVRLPAEALAIVRPFVRAKGDLSAVDTFIWRDTSNNPRYNWDYARLKLSDFFALFVAKLRRVNITIKSEARESLFLDEFFALYNRNILEELILECQAIALPSAFTSNPHPSLHTLVLDSVLDPTQPLKLIAQNMTTLQHFTLVTVTGLARMVTSDNIKSIHKLVTNNSKLHTFIYDSTCGDKATTTLDLYVKLFSFPERKTPTISGLEQACFKRLECHSKILRLLGKSVWESLYLDGDLFGLDDADPDLADSDFRTYYDTAPNGVKLNLLMRFHYLLCTRKPLNYSSYIRWAEDLIMEVTTHEASLKEVDSALVLPVLVALGSNLLEFRSPDPAAVKRLCQVTKNLLQKFEDPIQWLARQLHNPEIPVPSILPLFPGVMASFKWCAKGQVFLNAEQIEILHFFLQHHPQRIQSLLKDHHYDPRACLQTGERLASWLVREAVTFATSSMMVPWAEYALDSCAKSGVTLSWVDTNIDYGFFCCLLDSPAALSSMAVVFDRFDQLFDPKYLELRTTASRIPKLKALFEKHAEAWPDDPPIHETLEKLSHQVWKEVLWKFSNEKINVKDHVQNLHYGDMRSAVLTLVQAFPNIPSFVLEFMRGKNGNLVRRDPGGIRNILSDLFPEGMDGKREDCAVM